MKTEFSIDIVKTHIVFHEGGASAASENMSKPWSKGENNVIVQELLDECSNGNYTVEEFVSSYVTSDILKRENLQDIKFVKKTVLNTFIYK